MKAISTALVAAQKQFGPALKSSTNPHFKSKYADLAACVEAVIDALNANGIALVQRNIECESGVCVETVFVHESGETFSSGPLHVPAAKNDPQGYGSALTYARRYSLMAACGIAPEDDDGNAGTKAKKEERPIGKITPAAAILETSGGLSEEAKARMRELADNVTEQFAAYGAQGAYELIESEDLHDLEKIQLSLYLDSKVRNPITKYSRELRAQKEAA